MSETPGDHPHAFDEPPRWQIPWISRRHVLLYQWTNGEVAGDLGPYPGIIIHTTGRRSGKEHSICLPAIPDGDDCLVVGSFAGAKRHPAWYLNMQAEPEVRVQAGPRVYRAKAITLTGEERAQAWARITAESPWYADYQTRTEREIPLVRLTEVP